MLGVFILLIPFSLQTLHKLLRDKFEKKKEFGGTDVNVWCEFDSNLLGEIMGRLSRTDQARFRAVCKNWLAVRPINTTKSLPWYFFFDRSLPTVSKRIEFRVYEPGNVVAVHNISLAKLGIPSPLSYECIVVSHKHDWLFISCSRPRMSRWIRRYFILYSVFTKKIITLPILDYSCRFNFMRMFTTKPDSPNCVFFLINTTNDDKIAVITYHHGDKEWIAREFDRVDDFVPCICELVYIRGIMYIVTPYGQLASYNIVNSEFKFENLFVDELFRLNYESARSYRVFELNGELMLIYFGSRTEDNTASYRKPCIKMYDWSNKVWISVSSLGDNALFVSNKFEEVAVVNREEMSINGVISNKIYLFFDCGCLIYTIKDGELVEFKSIKSNLLEHGGGNLPEYNCDISISDATKAIYWLDPPVRY